MELKYYLRGLGLGIVVTAVIMGITSSKNSVMTDAEVIARAKELGMIESRVLSEAAQDDDGFSEKNPAEEKDTTVDENNPVKEESSIQPDTASEENTPLNTISDNTESESKETGAAEDTSVAVLPDDEEIGQEETPAEPEDVPMEKADAGMPMVITVGSGDGSYTVSKKLEDVGAIASASAFDTYLCENGYDKKIRAGSYTIPAEAGEEQIAKMITGLE